MSNCKQNFINLMDKLPENIQDNIKKYREHILNSDKNFIVLEDGFGAGKTTASMTCLEVGDGIVFDTHTQAKEKMKDYQRELSNGKCIHLASLQKYIARYNWKHNYADKKENVIIPSKIEALMDKIPHSELENFQKIISSNADKPYSPKFLAIKHDFDEKIHKLADAYSNLYTENTLKNNIIFTVKHLISVLDHKGKLFIDETLFNSGNKKEMEVLKAGGECLAKMNEAQQTNTPIEVREYMETAGEFLASFYHAFSDESELIDKYGQVNKEIMKKKFDNYEEYSKLQDFDRNEYMNKFYDQYVKRDDKEIYPELEVIEKIMFAVRLYKYGGKVTLGGGVKAKVNYKFCYDAFEKGLENKIVLMDAEFNAEWFKGMFDRWKHAEQHGVSMEDKGIERVEILPDRTLDVPYHYIDIGQRSNSTIRMNCYSYFDKANKYVKKHLNLRILSNIIKHRHRNYDETHGVVTTKKGKRNLFDDFENVMYFAEMEGSNKLKDVDYVWVIGTPRVGDLKAKVEENFGEPLDSIEEIAEKNGKNYYDFIIPSYFTDGRKEYNLEGKAGFKKNFSFDISEYDEETIRKFSMIWDLQILAKIRQAIGRKRDLENGKIYRVGMNHHSFFDKFENKEYDTAKTFIKNQFKEYPASRIDAKDDLNYVLEEKSDMEKIIDYIPKTIRKHFSDNNDVTDKVELGRKPRGYNKENLVKYMHNNDYSLREIERSVRLSKEKIRDVIQ